jgi:hypothetical protein
MTFQPLVKGFRVSAAKRPYVSRLRLHGRDFDFGNSPEAAIAYSRCVGEPRPSIKLLRGDFQHPAEDYRRLRVGAPRTVIGPSFRSARAGRR